MRVCSIDGMSPTGKNNSTWRKTCPSATSYMTNTTLTGLALNPTLWQWEASQCFFLSCKANARVKLINTGHGPHSSTSVVICVVQLLFVLFSCYLCCSMYCLCVNVYCHRGTTQLQLIYQYQYWLGKTKAAGARPMPVPHCLPKKPHELAWDWTQAFMVRYKQLTAYSYRWIQKWSCQCTTVAKCRQTTWTRQQRHNDLFPHQQGLSIT